ncbi:hypothetical protein C8F04DRAFT_1387854 [Mycena alexandri]|uniref:NB-ARC domain-containing protein n=1 Tax=Mycena alexandri TaxID=1745969 RepID=A0AAD6TGQ5_9AGAR|nr:hypothetical protein C8F04DRAFT_1387854 [Mycena alexandri]
MSLVRSLSLFPVPRTLHKIHACLRSQQELGRIKRFFKQTEITTQLDKCQLEVEETLDILQLNIAGKLSLTIGQLENNIQHLHQQFLATSETCNGTRESCYETSTQGSSSVSLLSMLPARPQIFHGRQIEVMKVTEVLLDYPTQVAILGPGGIGKTTLAAVILHSPDIVSKYPHRHFVSCGATTTASQTISAVAFALGLEPSTQLTDAIIRYFRGQASLTLLVLDNMETAWEERGERSAVEEFLSLLSGIDQLALLITLRGVERPSKVKWKRPFLPPLEPLHPDASRQIFFEISDPPLEEEESDFEEIVELTGHLPLAISLMASVSAAEGYSNVLSRWKAESISLISEGYEKESNLGMSIMVDNRDLTTQLNSNVDNIKSLLSYRLKTMGTLSSEDLHSILNLADFSRTMLKPDSMLLTLIPTHAEATDDKWVHWRYLMLRLAGAGPAMSPQEADVVIPETMESLLPERDPRQARFFKDVVTYYLRSGDPMKATRFNDIAMSLANGAAANHVPNAFAYSDAARIAQQSGKYRSTIFYARKGQVEARKLGSTLAELDCVVLEADAFSSLGGLSYALELCEAAQKLVIANGLQNSDREISIWDITAEIAFNKTEYETAYGLYQRIVDHTSLAKSRYYHIYASLCLIDIEMTQSRAGPDTTTKLIYLKAASDNLHWDHGVLFSKTLEATLRGSSSLLECFNSARQSNDSRVMFKCLETLSGPESPLSDPEDVFRWIGTYLAFARQTKHLSHTYGSMRFLADMLFGWGDRDSALSLLQAVREGSREIGAHRREMDCKSRIAKIQG